MVESPGRITLWGIEIFVAAAEEGSISAAAERLTSSPSAISQQITNLEASIGAVLLDRTTRPHRITAAGGLFLRRAQAILREASLAKAELAVQDLSQLTRLRLGVIEDFDAHVTPSLLTEMAGELRGCQFELETGYSLYLQNQLEKRSLDMVICADLGQTGDWMDIFPLLSEPFVVAAPKGQIDQNGDVLEQLKKLAFIRYSPRQIMGQQIEAHLARQRIEIPHRFELDSYHAILALVASGEGWSITTPMGYSHAQRFKDQIDIIPLPMRSLTRTITLFSRKDSLEDMPRHIAALMRTLLERMIVSKLVAELPWLSRDFRVLDG
jgi:DNA-binding transcriptional LysR family regulator